MAAQLTGKAARFVAEYLVDLNATRAAIRAGYRRRNADVTGSRLLRNARVAAAVSEAAEPKLRRLEFDADCVLQEAAKIAFGDIRKLFDAHGSLRPVHVLDDVTAAAVASFEVQSRRLGKGRPCMTVTKVRVADRLRALELLARYFGLLRDKGEAEVTPERLAALPPAELQRVKNLAIAAREAINGLRQT